jgi:hypothetical protein
MNQHMQYEMRDVPKNGVAGFFKNLLMNMSGGPIKTRDPIDWNQATGQITNAIQPEHSQKANFQTAVTEAQQSLDDLKRQNPNPSAEDAFQAVRGSYLKVLQAAPAYADKFIPVMTGGLPSANSVQYGLQQLNATDPSRPAVPATAPPPQADYNSPEGGDGAVAPTSTPPGAVRPADTVAAAPPAAPGGIEFEPGYGPQRFAALSNLAGRDHSPVNITQPSLVTSNGRRIMATMVMGSPNPADNGYWDASTQQKIKSPVTRESMEVGNGITDEKGYVIHFDPNEGHYVYTPGPDGKPFKRGYAPVPVFNPASGKIEYAGRGDAIGQISGGQAAHDQRTAEEIQKGRREGFLAADNRLSERTLKINQTASAIKDGILKGSIDTVTQGMASLGMPVDKATIDQAMANPQKLVDMVEQQRQQQLADAHDFWQREAGSVNQNFPTPATAPPPTPAPPRAAAPKTAPPPAAVAAPITDKRFGSLLK